MDRVPKTKLKCEFCSTFFGHEAKQMRSQQLSLLVGHINLKNLRNHLDWTELVRCQFIKIPLLQSFYSILYVKPCAQHGMENLFVSGQTKNLQERTEQTV